jgi:uncharacterized protein RhaS with RHS repeats
LHYNRHRYYDPKIGRFVSKDPIGLAGSLNLHVYAPNPIRWVDPLGLQQNRQANIPTQGGNARDTAVNAATTAATQGMTNAPGGVVTVGNTALQAGAALSNAMVSLVYSDYQHYKQLGMHKMSERSCLGRIVNQTDWDSYNSFEEGLATIGKRRKEVCDEQ